MVEAITKQECSRYGDFNGDCEFCLDAMECEQIAFRSRESKRKPTDDWMDVKGKIQSFSAENKMSKS